MIRGLGSALVLLCAGGALADGDGALSTEFVKAPLSVRQFGSSGLYGSYDVFKAFTNPSLLSYQARTWEVAANGGMMMGGDQTLWSVAGAYGGSPTEAGTFGGALLISGFGIAPFDQTDVFGESTGAKVDYGAIHVAVAALYQWEFVSFGLAPHFAMTSIGSDFSDDVDGDFSFGMLDIGTSLTLGRMDLGVVYHLGGETAYGSDGISFGAALRTSGRFKGAFSFNMDLPFTPSPAEEETSGITTTTTTPVTADGPPATIGGGVLWEALPLLHVRVGVDASTVELGAIRFGFTIPWRAYTFDYGAALRVGGTDLGMTHLVGLNWSFGAERKAPEGPKFIIGEKDRTMAVSNFDPQNVSAGDAAVISDMMRNQLIKEGAFNIVEKANMDKVLGEQAFQQTGCTTQECAVKLGKILNVKYLVVGSFGKALDQYVLSLRVIDVETAKAVYSDESYGANIQEVRAGITTLASNLTKAVKGEK